MESQIMKILGLGELEWPCGDKGGELGYLGDIAETHRAGM